MGKNNEELVRVEPLMEEDILALSTPEQRGKWGEYKSYIIDVLKGEDHSVVPARGYSDGSVALLGGDGIVHRYGDCAAFSWRVRLASKLNRNSEISKSLAGKKVGERVTLQRANGESREFIYLGKVNGRVLLHNPDAARDKNGKKIEIPYDKRPKGGEVPWEDSDMFKNADVQWAINEEQKWIEGLEQEKKLGKNVTATSVDDAKRTDFPMDRDSVARRIVEGQRGREAEFSYNKALRVADDILEVQKKNVEIKALEAERAKLNKGVKGLFK